MYTKNTQNARKAKYLGKFETKIKNILGAQIGSFDESLKTNKSHASVPLR
jgi:hypothetical protein